VSVGIKAPTLVVHGEEDRMVPPENGGRLAEAITGARPLMLRAAGHFYPTDEPRADREVIDFVLEQQRGATRASRGRLHEPQHPDRRPAGAAE
jgi:pimeloyl-ACP methyl ester carboxylesterase